MKKMKLYGVNIVEDSPNPWISNEYNINTDSLWVAIKRKGKKKPSLLGPFFECPHCGADLDKDSCKCE